MATSPLDFVNSDGFRKKLITRNLTPYSKSPNRPSLPTNYVYVQSDISVQDSPDKLIDEPSFANKLYPLNKWGTEGGYQQVPDPGSITNTKSNQGEYGPGQQDAFLLSEGIEASRIWKPLNAFGNNSLEVIDSAEAFSTLDIVYPDGGRTPNGQPYPNYNPSSYNPAAILLFKDPQGSDGLLSEDSYIARLGATTLRKEFEQRIATQIRQQTFDRANIFNVRSGEDLLSIISGRVPALEPNWTITVPQTPIIAATDLALRLAGSIIPISPIPGSYWDTSINPKQPTTLGQLTNAFRRSDVGKFLNRLLGANQTGSQIFYNNTGGGQKSRLFLNIDYNRYKPSFDRGLFDRLAGAVVGTVNDTGSYYVGAITSDPSRVFSPTGDLPVNKQGIEQQSPVYGPQELAQLYEGPSRDVKLGANGVSYSDGGGIEGGFTWVSTKYKGNAGKKVGIGGEILDQDQNFSPSSYVTTESTNREYRDGSILDDTQRLIDSQPNGGKRLQHVGNAIDQVSKVFNDGYKEITKGSKVLKGYVNDLGLEVGTEYCRIFTKDTPYLRYSNLQKTDGTTTENRRFAYSVLDKTYNLNISPNKQNGDQSSTNLIGGIGGGSTSEAVAKKYMFSIENLTWRTSSTPGYTTNDLPVCERGPNGGRVMWFAPYDLKFSESVTSNWKANDFIGRPEPVYTYNNTSRTGSLSWKIVVDHPSVLNVVVNKVLAGQENNQKVNNILESFFAGCQKYDLYELARQPGFVRVSPNDLYELQTAISSKNLTREQLVYVKDTIQTGVDSTGNQNQSTASSPSTNTFEKYVNMGFYFDNDIPKKGNVSNFETFYNQYTSSSNKTKYSNLNQKQSGETSSFFTNVVEANFTKIKELVGKIKSELDNNKDGKISMTIVSSASAAATQEYNKLLSDRRNESVAQFFQQELKQYIDAGRITFTYESQGENSQVMVYDSKTQNFIPNSSVTCSGDTNNPLSKEIYTVRAMSCRRSYIKNIKPNFNQPPSTPQANTVDVIQGNVVTETVPTPVIEQNIVERDNISKRIVRSLITECDYFEMIKEDTPLVFDNLRTKLKFFQPAFHSTTPEGLNSRLTFLQQCMRPGDTIPTVKGIDGSETYDYTIAATNTAFGAPPVLILRVGDFYNTKIIPTGLQLQYENLDINPEGIGVQPMIANVTLNFNFVGGSGLKTSIDRLQNSLTFNYYANTEMWDDRADVSDESYKVIDKTFIDTFGDIKPPTVNQAADNTGSSNGSTIGDVLSSNIVSGVTTGEIGYGKLMENLITASQEYFTSIVNEQKTISSQYNNAVRQQWMSERNYTDGNFQMNSEGVELFGKANNFESNINLIFDTLISNIESNNEEFIQYLSSPKNGLTASEIRNLKESYISFIKNKKSSFTTGITNINNNISNQVQEYISILGKLNTVLYGSGTYKGTDGYQEKNGNVIIYNISGTTLVESSEDNTYEELEVDFKKVQDSIFSFNSIINYEFVFSPKLSSDKYKGVLVTPIKNGKSIGPYKVTTDSVFIPFSSDPLFSNNVNKRVFMILSKDIVEENLYQQFKSKLTEKILDKSTISSIDKLIDKYWIKNIKPKYVEENKLTTQFIDQIEKQKLLNKYLKFTPYNSNKNRWFTFTTESESSPVANTQSQLIKSMGNTTNINTNKTTWNDSINSGAYISKSKLN